MPLMALSMPSPLDRAASAPAGLNPTSSSSPSSSTASLSSSPSSTASTPKSTEDVSNGVLMYIGSLLRSLNLSSDSSTASSAPASPTAASSRDLGGDWQAQYQSPSHTRPRNGIRPPSSASSNPHAHDFEHQLRNRFNGVLPFFRVWELKMEEADAEVPTMGRGTPPHPHRYIFKREMAATKLFLKDYSRRRGLGGHAASASSVSSVEVDISALQRRKQQEKQTPEEREAAQKARATTLKTQGKMPSAIADKRRKQMMQQQQQQAAAASHSHRQHSKLMS